jgi:hypothetical protein
VQILARRLAAGAFDGDHAVTDLVLLEGRPDLGNGGVEVGLAEDLFQPLIRGRVNSGREISLSRNHLPEADATSRQHKTHNTQVRELVYA